MQPTATKYLSIFQNTVDSFSSSLGRAVSWLTLLLVTVTFGIVVMRYVFNVGIIAIQESLLYLHSIIFLLACAYTQKDDEHVRVDIIYRPSSKKKRAWIDILGSFFLLLPLSIFLFYISWEYVASSWSYREGSREAGGLNAIYLLKTLLLIMPATLFLQALADIARCILELRTTNSTSSP